MSAIIEPVAERRGVFSEPPGHWWWGNFREYLARPLDYYTELHAAHGDFIRLKAMGGMVHWYLLSDAEAVEHILVRKADNYVKPPFFYATVRPLMADGLFSTEGALWKRQRKMIAPGFQRDRLLGFGPAIVGAAEETVEEWSALPDGAEVDVLESMVRLTLSIVTRCFFGADFGAASDEFSAALRTAFECMGQWLNEPFAAPVWVPTRRNRGFRAARAVLRRAITEILERRRGDARPRDDLLARLVSARDEQGAMPESELVDQVLTLIIAGHDTMAASLTWTVELLSRNREVQAELGRELAAVLGARSASVADLEALALTRMCFAESLRLYPPAWGQPRQAVEADEICGYEIPKGAVIALAQWLTHRHPKYWDDPLAFDPWRFLPERSKDRPKYAYFPFGGGPRLCIGQQLSLIEGPLILASLFRRFELEATTAKPVAPDPTFTLRPLGELKVRLRRRR